VLKQMLARLVAAAWRGLGARDQMDQATAEKVGKEAPQAGGDKGEKAAC
jgi:hypothetical protein